jgi:hypothetical protein
VSTSLRLVTVLDVRPSTPPRADRRAPRIHGLLTPLATKPDEKCRLRQGRRQEHLPARYPVSGPHVIANHPRLRSRKFALTLDGGLDSAEPRVASFAQAYFRPCPDPQPEPWPDLRSARTWASALPTAVCRSHWRLGNYFSG